MLNPVAKAWVNTLRSGLYKQGQRFLNYDGGDGQKLCCLGVLCEMAVAADIVTRTKNEKGYFLYDDGGPGQPGYKTTPKGWYGILPEKVREWAGLCDAGGAYNDPPAIAVAHSANLTGLNDNENWNFEQIADFIESEPKGLFCDSTQTGETVAE